MDEDAASPISADDLSGWLRGLKESAGFSYEDLAQATGEEPRNLKRWMAKTKPVVPLGDALLRLLAALNVQITPQPPRDLRAVNAELAALRERIDEQAQLARKRTLIEMAEDVIRLRASGEPESPEYVERVAAGLDRAAEDARGLARLLREGARSAGGGR